MSTWTCPDCGRRFGRAGQGHTCSPGLTLEEYFATAPPHEPPVAHAVLDHVAALPEAYVEPVQVGLFIKRTSTFAQLRTMTRWVALHLALPHRVEDPAPDRKVQVSGRRFFHTYNLHSAEDVTSEVLDLITQAYEADVR